MYDVHDADESAERLTDCAAAILGYKQPKGFLVTAVLLTACVYLGHIVAILHGVRAPYVEDTVAEAIGCWSRLIPNGFCAGVGALVGYLRKRRVFSP